MNLLVILAASIYISASKRGYMNKSDAHILDQVNSKKIEGYKYLYRNYYATLCNFSAKFFGRKEEAEDVVQDVFVRLWKSDSAFISLTSLTSFLYQSVKNASLNATRNKSKWTDIDVNSDEDISNLKIEDKTIEQLLIEEEYYRQIYLVINQLSHERKKIVLLSMEGFTNKEIADNLGVSINTVKTLKLKAYKFLRENLDTFSFILFLSLIDS